MKSYTENLVVSEYDEIDLQRDIVPITFRSATELQEQLKSLVMYGDSDKVKGVVVNGRVEPNYKAFLANKYQKVLPLDHKTENVEVQVQRGGINIQLENNKTEQLPLESTPVVPISANRNMGDNVVARFKGQDDIDYKVLADGTVYKFTYVEIDTSQFGVEDETGLIVPWKSDQKVYQKDWIKHIETLES